MNPGSMDSLLWLNKDVSFQAIIVRKNVLPLKMPHRKMFQLIQTDFFN